MAREISHTPVGYVKCYPRGVNPCVRPLGRFSVIAAVAAAAVLSICAPAASQRKYAVSPELFDAKLAFFKRGNPKVMEVALSIDDGPHILYAPKILEVLKATRTRATFFVVGVKVQEHPELVRQMIADGNEVGNHSMTHPRLDTLTSDEVKKEISDCEAAVLKAANVRTRLLRPPGERYTDEVLATAKELGYISVAANIGISDYIVVGDRTWYRDNPGYRAHVDAIPKQIFKQLKNGAIIDVHDMPTTADALETVIKGIRKRGYKIVTVSELLRHLGRR